jgi:hypothetical protein
MPRTRIRNLVTWVALLLAAPAWVSAKDAIWQTTTWQQERAMGSTVDGWRAVVSLDRARLVHFGPAATGENLLFAPATREHPNGWGGHRVWLGPQANWSQGWPPPGAWEQSAAEAATATGTILELTLPPAGDGWPSFRRVYRWEHGRLVCAVHLRDDGSRDAQVIQILQMPTATRVEAQIAPSPSWPSGYMGLIAGNRRSPGALSEPPLHATVDGKTMRLRHIGVVEKLGFRPHALRGRVGPRTVVVGRGQSAGHSLGEPDRGFFTQVYLGGHEPFVELEQLSPLYQAGREAVFEMVIQGVAEAPDELHGARPAGQP